MQFRLALRIFTIGACLGACSTPSPAHEGAARAPHVAGHASEPPGPSTPDPLYVPAPWTKRFEAPAVLVAERIEVEGPPGLLEHLAVLADDEHFETSVRTTQRGFEQTVRPRVREGAPAATALAYLDAWKLAALREFTSVERPGAAHVRVLAEGEAVWRDRDGREERGPRVEIVEPIERSAGASGKR